MTVDYDFDINRNEYRVVAMFFFSINVLKTCIEIYLHAKERYIPDLCLWEFLLSVMSISTFKQRYSATTNDNIIVYSVI